MTDGVAIPNQDNAGRGILLALIATFIFSTQDATSKFLVQSISPFQMTMMRFWAFGAMSLFLAWRRGPITQALKTAHPWMQITRGVLLIADIWLFVLSLRTVQLPELQAITLVYPLLVTLFAI